MTLVCYITGPNPNAPYKNLILTYFADLWYGWWGASAIHHKSTSKSNLPYCVVEVQTACQDFSRKEKNMLNDTLLFSKSLLLPQSETQKKSYMSNSRSIQNMFFKYNFLFYFSLRFFQFLWTNKNLLSMHMSIDP